MNRLEQLIKEYDENIKYANLDLEEWGNRNTLPGMKIRVNEAKQAVAKIEAEYGQALGAAAMTFYLDGSQEAQKKFTDIAAEEANTINVNAEGLYREFAQTVAPSLGANRLFGVAQLSLLRSSLDSKASDLDMGYMATPSLSDAMHVQDEQHLVDIIRDIVHSTTVNDEMLVRYIRSQVVREALKTRYTQSVVPVVIANASTEEVQTLTSRLFASGKVLRVSVPEEVDKDIVLESFTNAKKTFSPKKEKQAAETPEIVADQKPVATLSPATDSQDEVAPTEAVTTEAAPTVSNNKKSKAKNAKKEEENNE